ncbi:MAG: class I SAM-dependent methyltransferase [Bacteroidetes bacterium]|nr:MAG: class I SAM-dependent methyltransferase [Bacteroidota bacterium]
MYSEGSGYYKEVKAYYNEDSVSFKSRGEANPLLQRIRESFRAESEGIAFHQALEVGYGPGFDLVYFAKQNPNAQVYGIDISDGMCEVASLAIKEVQLNNCQAMVGSVEDVKLLLPQQQFDLIYVFFGSLNTVEDLNAAAKELQSLLSPNGKMVLTFVNKWYLLGILKPLLKLRFATAFKRLKKVWGGYSTSRFLPSKCYTPTEVRKAFGGMREVKHRGYSILFPAWYESPKVVQANYKDRLWNWDRALSKTPFWSLGEYTLFVFEKKA